MTTQKEKFSDIHFLAKEFDEMVDKTLLWYELNDHLFCANLFHGSDFLEFLLFANCCPLPVTTTRYCFYIVIKQRM